MHKVKNLGLMRLFFAFVLLTGPLSATNLNNLLGLLSILKPEFYSISVINGAVYWETGYIMNLWDSAWERAKDSYELEDVEHASALIQVVDRFFHRPPGTKGKKSDFHPSTRLVQGQPVNLAKDIGTILGFATDLSSITDDMLAAKGINTTDKQFEPIIKSLNKIGTYDALLDLKLGKYADLNAKEQPSEIIKLITNIKLLNLFKKSCKNLTLKTIPEQKLLLKALRENHQETQMVLLSVLWYVCGIHKDAIAEYYKSFEEVHKLRNHDTSIFVNNVTPDWEKWLNPNLKQSSKQECIDAVLSSKASLSSDMSKFDPELFEKFVFLLIMKGKYPDPTRTIGRVILWMNQVKQDLKFLDCMDTVVMSFILILAYNVETETFELEQLKKRGVTSVNPKLEDFFKGNHPAFEGVKLSLETMNCKEVHSAWSDVVSNIPGASYAYGYPNYVIGDKEDSYIWTDTAASGFIEQLRAIACLRSGTDIAYGLKPHLKNLVIVLNYLFNLNLYKNVYEEICKPEFLKNNLSKLEEKIGIKIKHFRYEDTSTPLNMNAIDRIRYSATHLVTFFADAPDTYEILIEPDHAEMSCLREREILPALNGVIEQFPDVFPYIPCVRGIKLKYFGFKNPGKVVKSLFLLDGKVKKLDLFWRDKWEDRDKKNFFELFPSAEFESGAASFLKTE